VQIDEDLIARARAIAPDEAEALITVLRAVNEGTLTADGPAAVAVVRRVEGALLALAALKAADASDWRLIRDA